jgi:hypothetical protein
MVEGRSYDPKSRELAEHFFEDEKEWRNEERVDVLAFLIQSVVEDYFEELKSGRYSRGDN